MTEISWDRSRCSVAGTLAVVGEKWSLLVLREAFLGVRRFADFQRVLGAPKAVLSDRLATLVEQGDTGDEVYLLLDGVLAVERDNEEIAQIGPGAILGEGAVLGDGTRQATLRAKTKCRIGVMPADAIDRSAMEDLAAGRRS